MNCVKTASILGRRCDRITSHSNHFEHGAFSPSGLYRETEIRVDRDSWGAETTIYA